MSDRPLKLFAEAVAKKNDDGTITIQQTKAMINHPVEGKEYVLQHTKLGWRCISWHPHYIMTDWVKTKNQALLDGDESIIKYYEEHKC